MKRTVNRYMELKRRQQEEFNALPLGFAFSQKQFDEMMKGWGLNPDKDTDKIYHVGGGGYIQKKDAELLHRTREWHDVELEAAIAGDTTGEGFIRDMFLQELVDHEFGYTMELDSTLDALGYRADDINGDKRLLHGLEKAITDILKER